MGFMFQKVLLLLSWWTVATPLSFTLAQPLGFADEGVSTYTSRINSEPVAQITGNQSPYAVGQTIQLLGNTSYDLNFDTLTYRWQFGDGRTSNDMNPKIVYNARGAYDVRLTVTDSNGLVDKATTIVLVGNRPSVSIDSPPKYTKFKVGDLIRLKASALDVSLNKTITDPLQYFWEVRLYNQLRYQPFLTLKQGNDFDLFPAPAPENLYSTDVSFLRVILTVYDADGVFRRKQRLINPKKVVIDFKSSPSGLRVLVESINVTTPSRVVLWENQVITIEAPDQGKYEFDSWSIGGKRARTYLATEKETITAFFSKTR